jgi:hypothetical protein
MFDEERLLELPTQSSIAWSARPVWDRKPPVGGRGNRQTYLDFTSRHHANRSGNHVGYNSPHSLAQPKSNVEIMHKHKGAR